MRKPIPNPPYGYTPVKADMDLRVISIRFEVSSQDEAYVAACHKALARLVNARDSGEATTKWQSWGYHGFIQWEQSTGWTQGGRAFTLKRLLDYVEDGPYEPDFEGAPKKALELVVDFGPEGSRRLASEVFEVIYGVCRPETEGADAWETEGQKVSLAVQTTHGEVERGYQWPAHRCAELVAALFHSFWMDQGHGEVDCFSGFRVPVDPAKLPEEPGTLLTGEKPAPKRPAHVNSSGLPWADEPMDPELQDWLDQSAAETPVDSVENPAEEE